MFCGVIFLFQIPKGIKIWKPDTSFFESDSTYGEESLRLYSDGTICWKQRATLTFPCILDFVFKQVRKNFWHLFKSNENICR